MDVTNGKTVVTVTIRNGPDAAGFDAKEGFVFMPSGDGTLNKIKQKSPDQYDSLETVATLKSAETMAYNS
jgi:hypothetical protein